MFVTSLMPAYFLASIAFLSIVVNAQDTSPSRHGTLIFRQDANVTTVTIDHPPINLVDQPLIEDLYDFMLSIRPGAANKVTPKVVVFESANPDFFLSHADITLLSATAPPPGAAESIDQLTSVARMLQSTTSTAFIACIDGRVTGSGNELSLQMDMRFAGPRAFAVNFENAMGSLTAGGGQLFMGPTIGRARTMEYILAAKGFDGATGKAFGSFNDYFDTSAELAQAVGDLSARIGLFPQHSLNDTKFTLNYLSPTFGMQQQQLERFYEIVTLPEVQGNIETVVVESGNQSDTTFELGIPGSVIDALYSPASD